jgi:hypothetical protein
MQQQQAQQQRAAVQAQVQAQQWAAQVNGLYGEYRAKVPEIDEIGEKFFPQWRQNLTKKEYDAVEAIFNSKDIGQTRRLFDRVIADYRKGKEKKEKPAGGSSPPPVVNAAGTGGDSEQRGMANLKDFGDMSPDDQAAWLIANKFVS